MQAWRQNVDKAGSYGVPVAMDIAMQACPEPCHEEIRIAHNTLCDALTVSRKICYFPCCHYFQNFPANFN